MTAPRISFLPSRQDMALPAPVPALPAAPQRRLRDENGAFAQFLLAEGVIGPDALVQMLAIRADRSADLVAVLLSHGLARDPDLTMARARFHGLSFVDPTADPPDPRLIDQYGVVDCLRDGVLPFRRLGPVTLILVDRPETLLRHRDQLEDAFGAVTVALAPRRALDDCLARTRSATLRHRAEARPEPVDSCRSLPHPPGPATCVLALAIMGGAAMWPALLAGWALFALILSMGLKAAALWAMLRARPAPPALTAPVIARLPVVSVIVALYREADIAERLVRRLGRLDYPRDLLDVILVLEEDDSRTHHALARADLPPWMRILPVPGGTLKTKPRALNYALDFCRGSIIGVYDAEDAPDPAQIRAVVDRFHQRGADVACLQGMLDFYNPATNWMARCFTIEYATWFRMILPGLDRLGLPIPLGGTTLFFRRAALEKVGAWDAHNVTEDADLGMRLYRHGFRTEVIESVTGEEANCRVLPWIRQRSRWIKGYMMTWRVHMRAPRRLWRELGPRGFIAFQILFLGSLTHALCAPLLISFWAVTLGLPHPVADALPGVAFVAMVGLFILCEALNLTLGVMALRRTRHRISPLWVAALHLYHPLAALASYKALWEVLCRPFYWDKTRHGACPRVNAA